MPDRAKANSAIMRCRTRVVPLRTVNESLNGDAKRKKKIQNRISLFSVSSSIASIARDSAALAGRLLKTKGKRVIKRRAEKMIDLRDSLSGR
jgi:hypothetical protein